MANEANKLQAIVFTETTLAGSHLSISIENAVSTADVNGVSISTDSSGDLPRYSGIILLHDWNALCSESGCTDSTCLEVTAFGDDNLELTDSTDLTVSATLITNFLCLDNVFTVTLTATETTNTMTEVTYTPETPASPYTIADTYIRQDINFAIANNSVSTFEFTVTMSI